MFIMKFLGTSKIKVVGYVSFDFVYDLQSATGLLFAKALRDPLQ